MSIKKILILLFIFACVVLAYKLNLHYYLSLDFIKNQQALFIDFDMANPFLSVAIFFAIYVFLTAISFPGASVMTLLAGALFGTLKGVLIVSIASTVGATLAFLGARYLFRDSFQKKFGDRIGAFNAGILKDGAFYLFTLRLIPIVPFFVINIVMGLTPMSVWRYFIVSQIGMLPGTFVYVLAGEKLSEIQSLNQIFSLDILSAFVLLGVFPYIAKFFIGQLKSFKTYKKFRQRKPKKYDYNLVAIGAGAAGLVTTYIGAAAKAKVALIEAHKMGGDCLNTGCVPSKAIIRTGKFLADIKKAKEYGVKSASADFDFADVMSRVSQKIKDIEPHDSVARYSQLGVECISGTAKIISPWEVSVAGRILKTKNIVIASGAEPVLPKIEGIESVAVLTSENLWQLKTKPKKLLVLGGGYIGCELAQAFARLGCEVTLVEKAPRLLAKEDDDVSEFVRKSLSADGVKVRINCEVQKIFPKSGGAVSAAEGSVDGRSVGDGSKLRGEGIASVRAVDSVTTPNKNAPTPFFDSDNKLEAIEFDQVLVALGRRARTKGFGLEDLGVELTKQGLIQVDENLRTNISNIYACGDCMSPYPFTHMAAHQAWYCAVNSMLAPFYSFKVDYRIVPSCMYTDPEVAGVGYNETRAREAGINYDVVKYGIDDLDRAIVDSAAHGFVKVLTAKGTDRILGATIVGANAGEILSEFVTAMKYNIGLNKILGTIHVYPTYAEANKYAAGLWKKSQVSPSTLKWAERFNRWQRG